MGGPTLTQPLFESAQDHQVMQRLRVSTPLNSGHVIPTYADWVIVGPGAATVADVANAGPFNETVLTVTTAGDGLLNSARSAVAGITVAIPALAEDGLVSVIAKCSNWAAIQTLYFRIAQNVAVNWDNYAQLAPVTTYDTFRCNDTWHVLPLIRQGFPPVTIAGIFNWAGISNGIEIIVQDTGTPVTFTFSVFSYSHTGGGPRGGVSIFFDQGLASARDAIAYTLEHKLGCSIAVIPERVGTHGYLGLADLRTFYLLGAEICATSGRDLTTISRQERLAELVRAKRWLYCHNFVNGADMFVYPDGHGRSGYFDAWTTFDVMRHYTCGRTTQLLPGTTLPEFPYTLPCLRVTNQTPATLAGYVTYSRATPASCQFFAFRGFDADPLDPVSYTTANFHTFIDATAGGMTCPPLAMVTQPGCAGGEGGEFDLELDGKLTWDAGLGAITHIEGPSDQDLEIDGGTGHTISLSSPLDLQEVVAPAAPGADILRLYAVDDSGWTVFESIDAGARVFRVNQDNYRIARNESGGPVVKGQLVYFSGSTGNKPNFSLARANANTTMPAVGMVTAGVAFHAYGQILIVGRIVGIDTTGGVEAWAEGDPIYVSSTVAGGMTNVSPTHPNYSQAIGTVEVVNAVNGVILLNIGPHLKGEESGTRLNTYRIGDAGAGTKTLTFDGTNDSSLTWDSTGSTWQFTTGPVGIGVAPSQKFDIGYGHMRFTPVTAPSATTGVESATAGLVGAGTYYYKVTFVTATGETELGAASGAVVVAGANVSIDVGTVLPIPLGPAGSGVTARRIYRTKAGGAIYYYNAAASALVADNVTTLINDGTADAALVTVATDFNTTAGSIYSGAIEVLSVVKSGTAPRVGVGIDTPEGTLHVHTATAGAITAHASYDDLIVENSGACGITILTPNATFGSLVFGDTDSNLRGFISYNHAADSMTMGTAGGNRFFISASGQTGIGTVAPTADFGLDVTSFVSGVRGVGTTGYGASFSSTSGAGCYGVSGSSYGGQFVSTSGYGVSATTTSGSAVGRFVYTGTSTNSVTEMLRIYRETSGTAVAGIGAKASFWIENSAGTLFEDGNLSFALTAVGTGAEECDFIVNLATGGALAEKMRLSSYGQLTITCPAAAETVYGLYVNRDANSASRAWAAKFDCANVGAGTLAGGLDLSSFSSGQPLLHIPVDAGAVGAHYGRMAVYVVGVGVKYIDLFEVA